MKYLDVLFAAYLTVVTVAAAVMTVAALKFLFVKGK